MAVKRDARVEKICDALPGANCGACGAPGCSGFAEGVVEGIYPVAGCTAGGAEVTQAVAAIMGTDAGDLVGLGADVWKNTEPVFDNSVLVQAVFLQCN